MNERNFSKRRRGGMRFRPSAGLNPNNPPKKDKDAIEARSEIINEKDSQDSVYDRNRHANEIDRAENIAAGLPPVPKPEPVPEGRQ